MWYKTASDFLIGRIEKGEKGNDFQFERKVTVKVAFPASTQARHDLYESVVLGINQPVEVGVAFDSHGKCAFCDLENVMFCKAGKLYHISGLGGRFASSFCTEVDFKEAA